MATMQLSTAVGDLATACCRSVVKVAIPQRRGSEFPINASRLSFVVFAPDIQLARGRGHIVDVTLPLSIGAFAPGRGNQASAALTCGLMNPPRRRCPHRRLNLSKKRCQPSSIALLRMTRLRGDRCSACAYPMDRSVR